MENKKVQLIVDVTKNIIEQYIKQLNTSIKENENNPEVLNDDYEYECTVERAIRALDKTKKALHNFENIFSNDKILSEEKGKYLWNIDLSEEEKEIYLVQKFSVKLFNEIGIPDDSIRIMIAHCITMSVNDEIDQKNILEHGNFKKYYNADGVYNVGDLYINNTLSPLMNSKSYYYYNQYKQFELDATGTYKILNKYFTELSKEKKLTIEDLKSTYRILQNCNGSENCSEIDCFEFLKSEIEYSYDDYMFTNFINFINKYNTEKSNVNTNLDEKSQLIFYVKNNICKQYNEQFGKQVNESEKMQLPSLELPPFLELSKEEQQTRQLREELKKMGIDENVLNLIVTHCILKNIPSGRNKTCLIESYKLDDIYNENGIYRVSVEENENKDKVFMLNVNEIYKLFDDYFMNFVTKKKLTPDDMRAVYELLYTSGFSTSIKGSFECNDFLKTTLKQATKSKFGIIDSEMANEYNKREIERLEPLLKTLKEVVSKHEEEKSGPRL